jgi:hypothetical protein
MQSFGFVIHEPIDLINMDEPAPKDTYEVRTHDLIRINKT